MGELSNINKLKMRDLATIGIFAAILLLFSMLAEFVTGIDPNLRYWV